MARDGDNLAIGQRRMRREARAGKAKVLPRSESAPTLAPVWEPGGDEMDELPWLAKPNFGADSRNSDDPHATPVADADGRLTGQWQHLLERISVSGGRSHLDLASAMRDGRPLQLRTGLLEQYYEMKRVLVEAKHFRVVEGIHRSTGRNHSLKIVSSRGRRRAMRELDPIHAWHLIAALCARTQSSEPEFRPARARLSPSRHVKVVASTWQCGRGVLPSHVRVPLLQVGYARGRRLDAALGAHTNPSPHPNI